MPVAAAMAAAPCAHRAARPFPRTACGWPRGVAPAACAGPAVPPVAAHPSRHGPRPLAVG
jgi:hypothetical protein